MSRVASLISRLLPSNRFVREVSVLVGGTVGAQAVLVLAAPSLTRLYSPDDFGILALFAALLSIGSVVASLRYELAIPLPEDDEEAATLLILSLFSLFAVAALSAIPILVFRDDIARLLNTPKASDYLYLLPVGIFFAGIYNLLNFWAIRMKEYAPLAKSKMTQSLIAVGMQLGGAPFGPLALLSGHIGGYATGSLSLALRTLRQRLAMLRRVRMSGIIVCAKRYQRFPLYSTWGALFNTAGSQLPPILFAVLFSPAVAGIYALANRVLSMPMQLLGQAIANVFFSDAAQAQRDGTLGLLVVGIHRRLAQVGMPPILLILFAGPEMFGYVFGREWRDAGIFAQWLAPWLYLVFIVSPLTGLFDVMARQAIGMFFQCAQLVVRVGAISAGAWLGDANLAVALFGLGSAACSLFILIWILRVSGNKTAEIWRPTFHAAGWAIALTSPVILGAFWHVDPQIWLISFALATLMIAARYTYLMKNAWL
jgi:O-antigen/teichoic acid export membrane protein